MSEQDPKYMCYIDEGDEHSGQRLNKLGTDSIIEAVAQQHHWQWHGIMRWEDGEWKDLTSQEVTMLFFEELKDLMTNGKDMEINRLLGPAASTPPPEFMQFMKQHFSKAIATVFTPLPYNPYTVPTVVFSGDQAMLVFASTRNETQP